MTENEIIKIIDQSAERYNINKIEFRAIAWQESRFNPDAVGSDGEIGMYQLLPKGAIKEYNRIKGFRIDAFFWDIENNVEVAAWFYGQRIVELLNHYNHENTLRNRIIAYNAGIGNLNKGIVPASTEQYIDNVKNYIAQNLIQEPEQTGVKISKKHIVVIASILAISIGLALYFLFRNF